MSFKYPVDTGIRAQNFFLFDNSFVPTLTVDLREFKLKIIFLSSYIKYRYVRIQKLRDPIWSSFVVIVLGDPSVIKFQNKIYSTTVAILLHCIYSSDCIQVESRSNFRNLNLTCLKIAQDSERLFDSKSRTVYVILVHLYTITAVAWNVSSEPTTIISLNASVLIDEFPPSSNGTTADIEAAVEVSACHVV